MTSTANRAGSPPRVRGKAYPPFQPDMVTGITPARAGKSTGNRENAPYGRDHPRACGEKFFIRLLCSIVQGSPPRVRGKVSVRFTWKRDTGITPARAGKRRRTARRDRLHRDHPRACGEKTLRNTESLLLVGSPPRVRGKARGLIQRLNRIGITPARAGKSGIHRGDHHSGRDHPRACGEKTLKSYRETLTMGSPPRVRGKDLRYIIASFSAGITPARAGKS